MTAIESTRSVSSLLHSIRDATEAAAYGFVYAVAAALTGGWADIIFAWGPSSDYEQYSAVRLIFEIALQASFNAAVAQILRQAVTAIPIDEISDNKVPAQNGGIVFAFVTFSRQPRWKAKVLALNAVLGPCCVSAARTTEKVSDARKRPTSPRRVAAADALRVQKPAERRVRRRVPSGHEAWGAAPHAGRIRSAQARDLGQATPLSNQPT